VKVFFTSKGKKVIIVYCDIVIDNKFYFYEDIHDLVKNKKLTAEEYDEIMSAFSGMPETDETINEYARSEDLDVRRILAQLGYAPEILVNDPDHAVRTEVANNGDYLEKLINDPHPVVRSKVAELGYRLDILVNDPSHIVREVVAEQEYGLEKLVHDPSPYVRAAVAEQEYGLDILKNDEHPYVQKAVEKAILKQKQNNVSENEERDKNV
jgi:hypothetical protein